MKEIGRLMPFLLFCLAMTRTPGPNTMMVLAASARIGLMGACPLIVGVAGGSALQMAAVGDGVGTVIAAQPALHFAMSIAGAGFLAWIAVQIALSGPLKDEVAARTQLPGFWGIAGFQWIKPKAWAVTTGAAATYLPADTTAMDVGVAAVGLAAASVTTLLIWGRGGALLRDLLRSRKIATLFNLSAALVLFASIFALFGGRT